MKNPLKANDIDLKKNFRSLTSARDVAVLLEVTYPQLTYYLYRKPIKSNYKSFQISKKSGGKRQIISPKSSLKILQRKLAYILQLVYTPKNCVHGFTDGKSIVSNAQTHIRKRYVFNIDIKDFFPSINFGRVRGMFMAKPYYIPENPATVLAQICCVDNILPQGAPTSPVVSNMICGKLDSELKRLALKYKCVYTRYADDITFSTTAKDFPNSIGFIKEVDSSIGSVVGDQLEKTVINNGFSINSSKTRLLRRSFRQEVTGLTVNETPNVNRRYIRNIRATLNSISKYGFEQAEKYFHDKFFKKQINTDHKSPPSLKYHLNGKIGYVRMVKGEHDQIYRKLFNKYYECLGKPPKYENDPFADIRSAIWILESEDPIGQGTGFMLKDYGLVTCQHVLQSATKAFQYDNITAKYDIKIIAENKDLDIAILSIDKDDATHFEIGDPTKLNQGDKVTLAGFPNYRFNDIPFITEARIASFRLITLQRWMLLSMSIISGNSGGPVLDRDKRVIGIAATGADNMDSASQTEHHGVIPITALDELKST